jgi:hypothetical protein
MPLVCAVQAPETTVRPNKVPHLQTYCLWLLLSTALANLNSWSNALNLGNTDAIQYKNIVKSDKDHRQAYQAHGNTCNHMRNQSMPTTATACIAAAAACLDDSTCLC